MDRNGPRLGAARQRRTLANLHHSQHAAGAADDRVQTLALGVDGALWIGTWWGGLARLDKEGRWQTYTTANTKGALPYDGVSALAPGADGTLWIGTRGGLANFRRPSRPPHRIVEVIGETDRVTQGTQTVSVVAFDSSYRTETWLFRYAWRMTEHSLFGNKLWPEQPPTRPGVQGSRLITMASTSSKLTPSISTASGANLAPSILQWPSPGRTPRERWCLRRQRGWPRPVFSILRRSLR